MLHIFVTQTRHMLNNCSMVDFQYAYHDPVTYRHIQSPSNIDVRRRAICAFNRSYSCFHDTD